MPNPKRERTIHMYSPILVFTRYAQYFAMVADEGVLAVVESCRKALENARAKWGGNSEAPILSPCRICLHLSFDIFICLLILLGLLLGVSGYVFSRFFTYLPTLYWICLQAIFRLLPFWQVSSVGFSSKAGGHVQILDRGFFTCPVCIYVICLTDCAVMQASVASMKAFLGVFSVAPGVSLSVYHIHGRPVIYVFGFHCFLGVIPFICAACIWQAMHVRSALEPEPVVGSFLVRHF